MKQYFSYFKFLFLILGVVAIVTGSVFVVKEVINKQTYTRHNSEAPTQRVYDYADKLSDSEEASLEELIAKRESQIGCDLVLVVINESVYEKYKQVMNLDTLADTDSNWEKSMTDYADAFYDENLFGFNQVHGDGALLLDNWYEGEKGTWFSTCGRVYTHYTYSMIDTLLDDVYEEIDYNPYEAYKAYIEDVYREMSGSTSKIQIDILPVLAISFVIAAGFLIMHIKGKTGEKTTNAGTYVENGSTRFNIKTDELVNKYVTSRIIPRNTSSGGGHSGGAGGHVSRGGVSHGGGGRRR